MVWQRLRLTAHRLTMLLRGRTIQELIWAFRDAWDDNALVLSF